MDMLLMILFIPVFFVAWFVLPVTFALLGYESSGDIGIAVGCVFGFVMNNVIPAIFKYFRGNVISLPAEAQE